MLSVPEELLIGFLSGVVSKGLTTPLSVITVQLQSEEDEDHAEGVHPEKEVQNDHFLPSDNAIVRVIRQVYSEAGLQGFFKGMSPSNTVYARD